MVKSHIQKIVNVLVVSIGELLDERVESLLILKQLGTYFPYLKLEAVEWKADLPLGKYNRERIQDLLTPLILQSDIILVYFYSSIGTFTLDDFNLALKNHKKVIVCFKTGFSAKTKMENAQYYEILDFKEKALHKNKLSVKEFENFETIKNVLHEDLYAYLSKTFPLKVPRVKKVNKSTVSHGVSAIHVLSPREKLLNGSKAYYESLRGSNGRFEYLNISEIILPDLKTLWLDTFVSINLSGKNPEKPCIPPKISEALPCLWREKSRHTLIVGEGGMGKTVSMLHLWSQFLKSGKDESSKYHAADSEPKHTETNLSKKKTDIAGATENPVPLFIALDEYNLFPEKKRKGFLMDMIEKNYFFEGISLEMIKGLMKTPIRDGVEFVPSIVLLLDGFNEITVDKNELVMELNHLEANYPGIQIVITNNFDLRSDFNWSHWNMLKLQSLDKKRVIGYLKKRKLKIPEQERLLKLLKNPMMLTLFTTSCKVKKKVMGPDSFCLKRNVETAGELLWDLMESQAGNFPAQFGNDIGQVYYYKFILNHFLPALGYEMKKAGLFNFTPDQLNKSIARIYKHFSKPDFLKKFREYSRFTQQILVSDYLDESKRFVKLEELKKVLSDVLHLLVKEGESFRFWHQEFRDYFAAVHVLNEMDVGIFNGEIPAVLKEQRLDFFIRRMIGEIEGEHYTKSYFVNCVGWKIPVGDQNRLYSILELCRGKFGEEVGCAVWNIVTIRKETRGELTGTDLSRLDLSGIGFNGVLCNQFYLAHTLPATFDSALVHETLLLPQGHSDPVSTAIYSPDGKNILSASGDCTIKVWDAGTTECLKTLKGHTEFIRSAIYSPDKKRILSVSDDKTIIEWDAETGKLIKTFYGHTSEIYSISCSKGGKKFLSASYDNTIKEWDADTGHCLKTYTGHTSFVSSAIYSLDEKKILSASWDNTIKEWDTNSGECLRTIEGHTKGVLRAVYSPDEKGILSASHDLTIKEWDSVTGKNIKTFTGHLDLVKCALYSPDGKTILSASRDNTIKEWNRDTGECMRTFTGHKDWVNSAIYSPDGKKILSASRDNTIKEWDIVSGECEKTIAGYSSGLYNATYSADGKRILSASSDKTIKEWNAKTGECIKILARHTADITFVVYSPDGKNALSVTNESIIRIWDLETGECIKSFPKYSQGISCVLYRPDGEKILVGTVNNKIEEWDFETGKCLKAFTGHKNPVTSIDVSPDGRNILSASGDPIIKIWDIESGICLRTLESQCPGIKNAVYSPDGNKVMILSIDDSINELDIKTGKCIKVLGMHLSGVCSVVYNLDGTKVLVSFWNGTIKELDMSGNTVMKIENIPGLFIQSCTFKNLNPKSKWSEEGLKVMKLYQAEISIK